MKSSIVCAMKKEKEKENEEGVMYFLCLLLPFNCSLISAQGLLN